MSWTKRIPPGWRLLVVAIGAYVGMIIIVAAWLIGTEEFTLVRLGVLALYVGVGTAIVGLLASTQGGTSGRGGSLDNYAKKAALQRERAREEVVRHGYGFIILLVGVSLAATGWFLTRLATCGRLVCP